MKFDAIRRRRPTDSDSSVSSEASADGRFGRSGDTANSIGYLRIAVAFLVVVILLVIFQYGIRGAARQAGIVASPQGFTALYFSQPNALPNVLKQNRLNVNFVIANHEGTDRVYGWTVNFVQGAVRDQLDSGSTNVRNNSVQLVSLVLIPGRVTGVGIVNVTLSSPHQSINFHLNIVPSGAKH